jgi:hypothetical protein
MPVTHPTAIRSGIADYVVDQLDLNTPPAKLVLQTSGGTAVATLTFSNPAFGSAASGVATASAITQDSSAAGGTAAKAELRQGGATPVVLCSVSATGGGGDIQLNNATITAGQTVSITSLTYTAPA